MGCKLSIEDPSQRSKSKEIDSELRKSHVAEKAVIKILLLGTGEAGKSTILKQMKIIHNSGFDEEELISGARCIHGILFRVLRDVLEDDASLLEGFSSDDFGVIQEANSLESDQNLENSHYEVFKRFFAKDSIRKDMISRKKGYHFLYYFIAHADRIMVPHYFPTQDDYLRLRQRTSGIVEYLFKVHCEITKGHQTVMKYRMIDVGGQRTERKKWIHCFENVNAILFIVSLAEYDQTLEEDPETNRMHESLHLFKQIFHNNFFIRTGFILFLNKKDIFEEKIKESPLSICFPELKDPPTDPKNYILSKFMEKCSETAAPKPTDKKSKKSKQKTVYHHFTCATDTEHIRCIFTSVTEMILRSTLEMTQLL
uniref:Uncharacterized protein n=1 Tax=Lepeophtheirus salmonis TaxID=72036 RepID=A0A0K2UX63_LEPSM